jgi:hypothetical protein
MPKVKEEIKIHSAWATLLTDEVKVVRTELHPEIPDAFILSPVFSPKECNTPTCSWVLLISGVWYVQAPR